MLREEAIDLLDNLIGMIEDNHNSDYDKALKMAIKSLEQEPCEDAISRQTVLDMMQLKMSDKELYKAVYDLPSVTPKPKTGHWIYDKKSDLSKCSICGAYCPHDELGRIETYYCPNCGAKMESEDKE